MTKQQIIDFIKQRKLQAQVNYDFARNNANDEMDKHNYGNATKFIEDKKIQYAKITELEIILNVIMEEH